MGCFEITRNRVLDIQKVFCYSRPNCVSQIPLLTSNCLTIFFLPPRYKSFLTSVPISLYSLVLLYDPPFVYIFIVSFHFYNLNRRFLPPRPVFHIFLHIFFYISPFNNVGALPHQIIMFNTCRTMWCFDVSGLFNNTSSTQK